MTVRDVFKVVGGGTPQTSNAEFWSGSIPWATSADLGEDLRIRPRKHISEAAVKASAVNVVPEGSVIVATRVGLGKVAIASRPIAFSQDCQGLIPDGHTVLPKFAALQLQIKVQEFRHISRGTTISGVTKKQLLDVSFDLPPVAEQEAVVQVLEAQFSRADAGILALKRTQKNLARYRASVLKAACEGRLVPTEAELAQKEGREFESGEQLLARILEERRRSWVGKGKYKEPVAPEMLELSEPPAGWAWASLDQMCPLFVDSAHRTPKYGPLGNPAVGPRDVVGGRLNLGGARLVNEQEFAVQSARHIPEAGDIVYSRELSLGWGALVPEDANLCLSQGMCLFRPHKHVNVRLLLALLNGEFGRKQAQSRSSGSAHPHINLGQIRRFLFPVPPIAEQQRIVEEIERRLSLIDALEATIIDCLSRGACLRLSILRQAFFTDGAEEE